MDVFTDLVSHSKIKNTNQNGQEGAQMNPGFLKLSEQRKDQIINAGFRIFSQNTYKKAPVSEIALEVGISKS